MVQVDEAFERERGVRPPLQRCDVILRDLPPDITDQVCLLAYSPLRCPHETKLGT